MPFGARSRSTSCESLARRPLPTCCRTTAWPASSVPGGGIAKEVGRRETPCGRDDHDTSAVEAGRARIGGGSGGIGASSSAGGLHQALPSGEGEGRGGGNQAGLQGGGGPPC